jgi:hypothetical protein
MRPREPVTSWSVTTLPVRLPGTPLRGLAPSCSDLIAARLASILVVPAVVLIVVWVVGR